MLKRPILTVLSTAVLTATAALSLPAIVIAAPANPEAKVAAKDKFTNSAYIVRLAEQPVTAYAGGIKGYAATKPKRARRSTREQPERRQVLRVSRDQTRPDAAAGWWGQQTLQLWLRLQWVRRRATVSRRPS